MMCTTLCAPSSTPSIAAWQLEYNIILGVEVAGLTYLFSRTTSPRLRFKVVAAHAVFGLAHLPYYFAVQRGMVFPSHQAVYAAIGLAAEDFDNALVGDLVLHSPFIIMFLLGLASGGMVGAPAKRAA